MGGVHASMTAALFPGNVACTPLLAPRSAAVAFCSGALQHATTWRPLTAPADRKQRVSCAVECIRNSSSCGMHALGMLCLHSASPDSVALQAESQLTAAIDHTCRQEAGCQLGCRAFLQCMASMHGQQIVSANNHPCSEVQQGGMDAYHHLACMRALFTNEGWHIA